jgi:hypothetical protein
MLNTTAEPNHERVMCKPGHLRRSVRVEIG